MSIVIKQGWYRILALGFAGIGGLAVLAIPSTDAPQSEPYRVTIIAEKMRFYQAQDLSTPNPTLAFPSDRRIEIVFRNQDKGVAHRLGIPELGRETRLLESGKSAVLRVGPFQRSRVLEYICDLHPVMMRGTVRVGQ